MCTTEIEVVLQYTDCTHYVYDVQTSTWRLLVTVSFNPHDKFDISNSPMCILKRSQFRKSTQIVH